MVVRVVDEAGVQDNYIDLTKRAIEYWKTDGEAFTTWEPQFVIRPDAENPDVVIRFVDGVWGCGIHTGDDITGCASILGPNDEPNDPEVIEVDGNQSEYGTYSTIRHELGHLLGLGHNAEPQSVMSNSVPEPTDPDAPGVYGVHIEIEDAIVAEDGTRKQLQHALDYYESGAGGWMEENVTFAEVDDPENADIRFVVFDGDLDGSEAFLSEGLIRIDVLWVDTRGWHAGYWLGFYFGAESIEDLPAPFDDPQYDDRRKWW